MHPELVYSVLPVPQELLVQVLSDSPIFVLLNSYTTGLSASVMACLLGKTVMPRFGGRVFAAGAGALSTAGAGVGAGVGTTFAAD